MSSLTAFELKPGLSLDALQGATIAYGPLTYMFDIKEALVAGNGVIETDDQTLISTLTGVDILQGASAPQDATPTLVPGGGDAAVVGAPTVFEPQGGLPELVQIEALHAEEPSTVEEAQNQGAPPEEPAPEADTEPPADPPADEQPSGPPSFSSPPTSRSQR